MLKAPPIFTKGSYSFAATACARGMRPLMVEVDFATLPLPPPPRPPVYVRPPPHPLILDVHARELRRDLILALDATETRTTIAHVFGITLSRVSGIIEHARKRQTTK